MVQYILQGGRGSRWGELAVQNKDSSPGREPATCTGGVENLGARGGGAPPDCRQGVIKGASTALEPNLLMKITKPSQGGKRGLAAHREGGTAMVNAGELWGVLGEKTGRVGGRGTRRGGGGGGEAGGRQGGGANKGVSGRIFSRGRWRWPCPAGATGVGVGPAMKECYAAVVGGSSLGCRSVFFWGGGLTGGKSGRRSFLAKGESCGVWWPESGKGGGRALCQEQAGKWS